MDERNQLVSSVREGQILAGKYRVERVLGVGGMGVVVAAYHLRLDVKVALKFLLPAMFTNPDVVARFEREARAAAKIKSEHIARVTDVGTLDDGAPYIVMEYLEGQDLSAWLTERGPLRVEQAVDFILQVCVAIAEAHTLGIVHRDLKPSNLFVTRGPDGAPFIKVLDFGISKTTGLSGLPGGGSATTTSNLMGSPLYMSPEQMRSSKDVDARSDIWALGVILFELITGGTPFTGDTMPELVLRVATSPPTPLRDLCPDAPPSLEKVLLTCMQKERDQRYESVGALAAALLPFAPRTSKPSVERISGVMMAAGLSEAAITVPPSTGSRNDQGALTATAAAWGHTAAGQKRGPWLAMAALVLVLAAASVGVFLRRLPGPGPVVSASALAPGKPEAHEAPPPSPPDTTPTPVATRVEPPPKDIPIVTPAAPPPTVPQEKPKDIANRKTVAKAKSSSTPTASTAEIAPTPATTTSAHSPSPAAKNDHPPPPPAKSTSIFDDR